MPTKRSKKLRQKTTISGPSMPSRHWKKWRKRSRRRLGMALARGSQTGVHN